MKTLAAVLVETGKPLELAELEIPALRPGQVLVEIECSGVCHTQVGEWLGWRGPDPFLPHCLGHEAAGRVLDQGADVTRCRRGDSVLLSWIKAGGADVPGTVYQWGSQSVNAGGVTTFAQHAVVSENRVTRMPAGLSWRAAALVGCAVATGFGSVLNTGAFVGGESVVVFGVGGIGLCAVAAAAAAGAASVVAVDPNTRRLELARQLGATDVLDPTAVPPLEGLRQRSPRGFDLAIEATGRPDVMQCALACVRPRGGRAVVVGNARFGETLQIDPREFNQGKRLLGTWGGDTQPDRDFPKYCDWIIGGRTPIEMLFEREYLLTDINTALADLQAGRVSRPLVQMKS